MKIVFMEADALGRDVDLAPFYELGEVAVYGKSEPGQDAGRIRDADIIVANRVRMGEALLKDCRNLKLICLTATGVNQIDFAYVGSRGIRVANVRGYSTDSVAQHTFALLLYLYENLNYFDQYVKSGGYTKGNSSHLPFPCFHELAGKRWGIIGLGNIGKKVAKLASAFGCQVAYYSTTGTHDDQDYCRVEKEALLRGSDIISIHAPLNASTLGLIGEEELRQMKKEAVLLNLARGAIVDEAALAKALKEGWIAGAGLDVLAEEPMAENHPLLRIPDFARLVVTPHIGWAAIEARQRCAEEVRQNIIAFLNGQERNLCYSDRRG